MALLSLCSTEAGGSREPIMSWFFLKTVRATGSETSLQTDKDLGVLQFGNNSLCLGVMVHLSGKKDTSEQ